MYNLSGQIGGDAELSSRGKQYALKLPELVRQSVGVSHPKSQYTALQN
jgi:6-phosphofructo-2-kinase/fructose-2,6-biphosphatase 2